jgi:tetratricopeptide (TPR) repeat protein
MMNKFLFSLLPGLTLVASISQAQVKETPATLGLIEGGNPQGYVQNSNDQGVLFSAASGGAGQMVPYAKIRGDGLDKLVRFEERTEVLGNARALFAAGSYDEAAAAFGKVAQDYAIILSVPQNFATEALFYQIESIKRSGKYALLADLVNSPAAATITTKLADGYKRPFEFQKLWALYGKNNFAALKTALEVYQEPVVGDAKLLKTPGFKKLAPSELTQVAFMRAKVYDSEGKRDLALEDYYRTFTLTCGNDVLLSKLSMGAAMQIQKEDPMLAKESKLALTQMQSIAYVFSKRFGKDTMPPDYQAFAVRPEMPKLAAPAPAPEEGAAPAESAPEAGAKPAEADAKPAEADAKPAAEEKPAEK